MLCILSSSVLSAQLDSTFVETFGERSRINGGIRYRDNSAVFSVNDREELTLTNRGLALRIGGRYRWIGYTFSIPISDLGTGSELGDAKSLGANIQFYRNTFYLNANVRRTIGFERDSPDRAPEFREDIRFLNALLFGFRILNSKRFSLRSSFRLRNRQLRSAGSWLVGGAVARQVIKADSLELPLREAGTSVIDRFSQTKIGTGVGYAYTFIFGKYWFATPLLIAGPEIRFIAFDPLGTEREVERLRLSARVRGRISVGANGIRNYIALSASYLPSADNSDAFDTRVDEVQIELRIGHRIGVKD
ncbi:DUF4421 family protein [Neolewinella maritima]|uniref:DUF4421 family protein n=1 Tax=Neolewinella maritima TaxID=1383882 RepID=UPI001EE95054|nr:DUF4421 family protein [Neolewinella maritima]